MRRVVGGVRFLLLEHSVDVVGKILGKPLVNYCNEATVPPSRRTPLVGDLRGPRGTTPSELRAVCSTRARANFGCHLAILGQSESHAPSLAAGQTP
jgi:hypothetical protein